MATAASSSATCAGRSLLRAATITQGSGAALKHHAIQETGAATGQRNLGACSTRCLTITSWQPLNHRHQSSLMSHLTW